MPSARKTHRIHPAWVVIGVVVAAVGVGLAIVQIVLGAIQVGALGQSDPDPNGSGPVPQGPNSSSEPQTSSPTSTSVPTSTSTPTSVGVWTSPPSRDSAVPVWVTELEPLTNQGLWREEQAKLRDRVYVHALTVATEWGDDADISRITYALDGKYKRLTGVVGLPDGGKASEVANFEVLVDQVVVFEAQAAVGDMPTKLDLDVTGANDLELHVTDISTSGMVAANAAFADLALK